MNSGSHNITLSLCYIINMLVKDYVFSLINKQQCFKVIAKLQRNKNMLNIKKYFSRDRDVSIEPE